MNTLSRRKVVQHGPCTLTVSLPKEWTKKHRVSRGDNVSVENKNNGLFISTGKPVERPPITVDLRNKMNILAKTIGALYKLGHNEIRVMYCSAEELVLVHHTVNNGYIGFEIIDEIEDTVIIKKVSEPDAGEFSRMFRRIFHFLTTTGYDGYVASSVGDLDMYERLVRRDRHIDKLADFCRRVVGQHGQTSFKHDASLYHVIEQLEKIGDLYRDLNKHLLSAEIILTDVELILYKHVNALLVAYEEIFFSFSIEKAAKFRELCQKFVEHALDVEDATKHNRAVFLLEQIPRELYNLLSSALMLNL